MVKSLSNALLLQAQTKTSYGWANVALAVGHYDVYEACTELIAGLEATQFFNKRNYRCYPANYNTHSFC